LSLDSLVSVSSIVVGFSDISSYFSIIALKFSSIFLANPLPSLVGGYFLTGAELKAPDELVRGLYDAVKPKLYYAYDRYADAYLPVPT